MFWFLFLFFSRDRRPSNSKTYIKSAMPFIPHWDDSCHTAPSVCPMEKSFPSYQCTRKRENGQGKNPKHSMSLQLTAPCPHAGRQEGQWSKTAVFQCFQDTFQALHSWSYSVACGGTLYPCQGSAAAKPSFISSSAFCPP